MRTLYSFNMTLLTRKSSALFYYEYILTIPDEVRLFWQHPRSLATVLYLLIRYASLVTNTARLVFSAPEYLYPKVRLTATGCVEHA